jgi:hypothetical protein
MVRVTYKFRDWGWGRRKGRVRAMVRVMDR